MAYLVYADEDNEYVGYELGYDAGYKDGYNIALTELIDRKYLTDLSKRKFINLLMMMTLIIEVKLC